MLTAWPQWNGREEDFDPAFHLLGGLKAKSGTLPFLAPPSRGDDWEHEMGHELSRHLLVDFLCLEEKFFVAVFWGLSRRVVSLPRPAVSLCVGVSLQHCPVSLREATEPGKSLPELWETPSQKEEEFQPPVRMWPKAFFHFLPGSVAWEQQPQPFVLWVTCLAQLLLAIPKQYSAFPELFAVCPFVTSVLNAGLIGTNWPCVSQPQW